MRSNCTARQINVPILTADEACEGLAEEGQQVVHVCEGGGLLRVTLQHGPAGGHVQSGRIDWVHSGARSSLQESRLRKTLSLAATVREITRLSG